MRARPLRAVRDSVRQAFVAFTAPLEGIVDHLYLDIKGLVTIGIGNLVDPIQYALPLPFVHRDDGRPAQRDEIAAEWLDIKNRPELARLGHRAAREHCQLYLTADGIDNLVARKLNQNDQFLAARFTGWAEWPADAQLATLSLAWACGPAFRFPMLEAAVKAQNFELAAQECAINPQIGTIVARNAENRTLYRNAARVLAYHLDPNALIWPADLTMPPSGSPELPDTTDARITGTSEAMREALPEQRPKE